MTTITLEKVKHNGHMVIKDDYAGKRTYVGYTKKEAVQSFCAEYGYKPSRIQVIQV